MKFFSDAACDPNVPLAKAIRLFDVARTRQMRLRTTGLILGAVAWLALPMIPPGPVWWVYGVLLAIAWFPFLLSVYWYGPGPGDGHEVTSWVRTLEERHRQKAEEHA